MVDETQKEIEMVNKWKTKVSKAIRDATADEFFTWKNPLVIIIFLIIILWIIEKVIM